MRKLSVAIILVAVLALFGCSKGSASTASAAKTYQDGVYFAQQDGFPDNGWKYIVTITVKNGKIADVQWNGANAQAGTDKITRSKDGQYPMKSGGAQDEWYVEADRAAQWLVDLQDPAKMVIKDDGTTDAVSGVTIKVSELQQLAEEALAAGPVGLGPYKDGSYSAQLAEMPESGWQDKVDVTVVSGRIVAAYWDPFDKDGRDKYQVSKAGEYGMLQNGGAQAAWWEQADKVTAELIKTQDPSAVELTSDGHTDAISGVSIHVNTFFQLAAQALVKK